MAVEALAFFPGGCNRLPVGDRILGREDDPRSRWLDPPACGQPRRFGQVFETSDFETCWTMLEIHAKAGYRGVL
jgi:hypothetical protein